MFNAAASLTMQRCVYLLEGSSPLYSCVFVSTPCVSSAICKNVNMWEQDVWRQEKRGSKKATFALPNKQRQQGHTNLDKKTEQTNNSRLRWPAQICRSPPYSKHSLTALLPKHICLYAWGQRHAANGSPQMNTHSILNTQCVFWIGIPKYSEQLTDNTPY